MTGEDPEHKFMCFLILDIIKELFIYPKGLKWLWSLIDQSSCGKGLPLKHLDVRPFLLNEEVTGRQEASQGGLDIVKC